jgi:hypothetical protein
VSGGRARAWWAGLTLALVLLATAVALIAGLRHQDHSNRRPVPTPAEADADAKQACTLTRSLLAEVAANGSSAEVLDLADRAAGAADDAAYGSARWVPLNGAVQALGRALRVNDGRLAAIGMQQIDAACAPTGVRVR